MLQSLLDELNAILSAASRARHESILRGVTDLFLEHATVFSPGHVAVFDDVIGLLIRGVSKPALEELSHKLAEVDNAPKKVVSALARHSSLEIASPILRASRSLSDDTLADIAGAASPKHLQVLAARAEMSAAVTDIVIDRGNVDMVLALVSNPKAQLSELGFVKLINQAKSDHRLAWKIAERTDLPAELEPFLKLALAS